MILVVSLCAEKMHDLEFVRPVCALLQKLQVKFQVVHYSHVSSVPTVEAVILCGTSLADFEYLRGDFSWLLNYSGKVLGICAGAQVLCRAFGGKLIDFQSIGKYLLRREKPFFDLLEEFFVYALHAKGVELPSMFETVARSDAGIEMFKSNDGKKIGMLFHPEVLNSEMIEKFVML